jgi:hypothetical protein
LGSVGPNGENRREDVIKAQMLTKFSKRDEPLDGAGIRPIEEKWRDKLPPKGWVRTQRSGET